MVFTPDGQDMTGTEKQTNNRSEGGRQRLLRGKECHAPKGDGSVGPDGAIEMPSQAHDLDALGAGQGSICLVGSQHMAFLIVVSFLSTRECANTQEISLTYCKYRRS